MIPHGILSQKVELYDVGLVLFVWVVVMQLVTLVSRLSLTLHGGSTIRQKNHRSEFSLYQGSNPWLAKFELANNITGM